MSVGKHSQVDFRIHDVLAAAAELVVFVGLLDHRSGDIHAVGLFEVLGQGLCEASDAASEIERPASLQIGMQRAHLFERSRDLPNSRLEKLAYVPAAALAIGMSENCPEGITRSK